MYKDVTLTVQELFERVWKKPVVHLAREIGVSDVAFSKACRKAGIQLPKPGHWVKAEVKRPGKPAPPTSNGSITFRVLDRSLFQPQPPSAERPSPKPSKLLIPSKLSNPHPLVQKWLQAVKQARVVEGPLELRQTHVLNTRISREMVDRSALLLDTPIKHTEQCHCAWTVDEYRTAVTLEEETFYVTLRERITKTLPSSLLDSKRRGSWELMLPLGWRDQIVYASTGELTLSIREHPDYGCQRTWSDSKTCQLEGKLHLFVEGHIKLISWIRAVRLSDEAQQREFLEEDSVRREVHMVEERQRALQKRLLENMERWERAERLRRFINAVAVGAGAFTEEERRQADAWAEWARAQVDSIDPVLQSDTTSLEM